MSRNTFYPDAQGTPVNEYWELDNETGIGSRLSARHMARIISYMKVNGGYTIVQTQELGNCLYASILRGTDIRKEFTTTHLRRMLVVLISKNPHFFFQNFMAMIGSVQKNWIDRKQLESVQRPMQEIKGCQGLFV